MRGCDFVRSKLERILINIKKKIICIYVFEDKNLRVRVMKVVILVFNENCWFYSIVKDKLIKILKIIFILI